MKLRLRYLLGLLEKDVSPRSWLLQLGPEEDNVTQAHRDVRFTNDHLKDDAVLLAFRSRDLLCFMFLTKNPFNVDIDILGSGCYSAI